LKTPIPWLRVLIEGVVIVGSILLAFGIDAWWDSRVQRSRAAEHLEQLSLQLRGNGEILDEARVRASEVFDASRVLNEVIGPDAAEIPSDSLARLLDNTFRLNMGAFEVSALEALLSEGVLAAQVGLELQQALIQYRIRAEAAVVENGLYLDARRDLIDTLIELGASVRVVTRRNNPGDSDFPLPTADLLRDVALESRVFEIGLLANRTRRALGALEETSDLVLELIGSGAP
jgi:hypothetical protein